jgi:hypothetical protein
VTVQSMVFSTLTLPVFVCGAEFDAIAATRGGMEEGMSSRRLLSELLLQLTEQKQIQNQESKDLFNKLTTRQSVKQEGKGQGQGQGQGQGKTEYPQSLKRRFNGKRRVD